MGSLPRWYQLCIALPSWGIPVHCQSDRPKANCNFHGDFPGPPKPVDLPSIFLALITPISSFLDSALVGRVSAMTSACSPCWLGLDRVPQAWLFLRPGWCIQSPQDQRGNTGGCGDTGKSQGTGSFYRKQPPLSSSHMETWRGWGIARSFWFRKRNWNSGCIQEICQFWKCSKQIQNFQKPQVKQKNTHT